MYPTRDKYQSDRISNICHLGHLKTLESCDTCKRDELDALPLYMSKFALSMI